MTVGFWTRVVKFTLESPRSFLLNFFCTHTVAESGPTEEILILISIQQELHKGESEVHLLLAICANCCMVSFALIDALF